MSQLRKTGGLREFIAKHKISPIKEDLGYTEPEKKTTKEHIKELQERLVQTCIDYINEKGLDDIYQVRFNADSLAESAKYGSWQSCTDSYIGVEGIRDHKFLREDGEEFVMAERYDIGEYM